MKLILAVVSLMALTACQAKETKTEVAKPAAATSTATDTKSTTGANAADCDEKAKQPVKIENNELKLGNTDAGCSLE